MFREGLVAPKYKLIKAVNCLGENIFRFSLPLNKPSKYDAVRFFQQIG